MFAPDSVELIYDNGGADSEHGTLDRYSVYVQYSDGETELICSGADPSGLSHVAEAGQFDIDIDGDNDHLGKEIEWKDLPERVRNFVNSWVEDYENVIAEREENN